MNIVEKIAIMRESIQAARGKGLLVGLVPTMGALHEGHLSLVRRCRDECGFAVVSIFVNPTQFAPNEDFDNYPRTLDEDYLMCKALDVDLVFAPLRSEMYPGSGHSWVEVDKLSDYLCGASRPHFFRGVCTVVGKLFNIMTPDKAYFGQKDYQQLAIIHRMVIDLNIPVDIVGCPTVREQDGLAMSSRNRNLDPGQREQAACLHEALRKGAELIAGGQSDPVRVIADITAVITAQPESHIDYISIVDKELLYPVEVINGPVLIALAVQIGPVRLIDNILVDPPQKSS